MGVEMRVLVCSDVADSWDIFCSNSLSIIWPPHKTSGQALHLCDSWVAFVLQLVLPPDYPVRHNHHAHLRKLFAAYGQVVTDIGPPFTLAEFSAFMKSNGVKHIKCSPYHPPSNRALQIAGIVKHVFAVDKVVKTYHI